MLIRPLLLIVLWFPLTSLSSSGERNPGSVANTFRVTATGGLRFDVRGSVHARLHTYTYRAVPDTRGWPRNGQPTTMLSIRLNAPGSQWHSLYMTVTNYNSLNVRDKLYSWTYIDYRNNEPLRDENVECHLKLTNSNADSWDLNNGQIDFEYYGHNRVRGTFTFDMIHRFYRRAEPDASKASRFSGSFDTEFDNVR